MPANSKLKILLTAPWRFARRHGFGVHSPFAFNFINGVLRSKNRYYAQTLVKRVARERNMSPKMLMLLFRIAVHFDVRSAAAFGPGKTAFDKVLRLTRSDILLNGSNPSLVVADGPSALLADALTCCINSGGTVVLFGLRRRHSPMAAIWEAALSQLNGHGMSFTNGKVGILVAGCHLPRQDFRVWL